MNNTITMQLYSLLIFIITGIVIGVFFDIFRILRKSFKTPDFITYIEDILFWIFSGILFLFVLFKFNNGEIRNYVVIGLIIGILVYVFTVSKYFIKISVSIIKFLKKILLYPLKLLIKLLKPFFFIVINVKKSIVNFCKKIKKSITERRILRINVEKYNKDKNKCNDNSFRKNNKKKLERLTYENNKKTL